LNVCQHVISVFADHIFKISKDIYIRSYFCEDTKNCFAGDKEQCWRRTETEIQKRDRGKLEWKIGSTQAQELPHSSVRGVTTPFRFTRRPDANVCIGRATFFYLTRNSCAVRNKIAWNARRLYKNRCEDIYLSSKIKTFRKEINAAIYYADLK